MQTRSERFPALAPFRRAASPASPVTTAIGAPAITGGSPRLFDPSRPRTVHAPAGHARGHGQQGASLLAGLRLRQSTWCTAASLCLEITLEARSGAVADNLPVEAITCAAGVSSVLHH